LRPAGYRYQSGKRILHQWKWLVNRCELKATGQGFVIEPSIRLIFLTGEKVYISSWQLIYLDPRVDKISVA